MRDRRSILIAAMLAIAGLVAGACGSTDGTGAVPSAPPPGTADATGGTTPAARTSGGLARQYGVRYCEVLTVTVAAGATKAEVWGTQGLNDCPQAAFAAIDPATVVREMGVTAALPNGPRYWVLDDIVAHQLAGSGQVRPFGDIEMRSIATIDFGPRLPDRTPYTGVSVERDTEFRFDAGRTVYELTAADGAVYIMQSYSLEIDPTLDVEALSGLGSTLALPAGWTYTTRVLPEPLVVEDVDGLATVIQDELHNSYQLRSPAAAPGAGTSMPAAAAPG